MEKREIVGMYPKNKRSKEEILRKVRENPELQHIYDSLVPPGVNSPCIV